MDEGYGIESPGEHSHAPHRKPARYLVVIEEAGTRIARFFLETREQVAEVDASTEEIARMTGGLTPVIGARGGEWDRALQGHSAAERAAAEVYTLEV
jgi:hypothetical protein